MWLTAPTRKITKPTVSGKSTKPLPILSTFYSPESLTPEQKTRRNDFETQGYKQDAERLKTFGGLVEETAIGTVERIAKIPISIAQGTWEEWKRTPQKIKENIEAGAEAFTEKKPGAFQKTMWRGGMRTAGDVAIAIFAPISSALGAILEATGGQKLIDKAGEVIADKSGITDIKAFQKFAMEHPNAGEDFNRLLMLGMAGMDKSKIEPKNWAKDIKTGVKTFVDKITTDAQPIKPPTPTTLPDGRPTPILETFKPKPVPEINPLAQEARKYKSAEEFVKAQSLYHGTSADIQGGKLSFGAGEIRKGGQSGGLFLSDTPESAQVFGKTVYQASPEIKTQVIDLTKPDGIKQIENYIGKTYKTYGGETIKFTRQDFESMFPNGKTDFASISQFPELVDKIVTDSGKRGIAFNEYAGGKIGKTYQILNGDIPIKTKSQLTDIWNKAQEPTQFEPGISITSQKVAMEAKAKGIIDEFPEMSKIEPMRLAEEATKAQELIKTNRESALERIKSVQAPDIQKGAIFIELKKESMKNSDVTTIRQLAKTNIGTGAADALKAFDAGTRFDADPVMAIKSTRNARIESVEKTQKINVEKTIKEEKTIYKEVEVDLNSWSGFLKSIEC